MTLKHHLDHTRYNQKTKVNGSNYVYKSRLFYSGRVLWISGAPGMGKSTSAQILGKNHGYVYYEGDAFGSLRNPFNKIDSENPSLDQIKMKNLKGTQHSKLILFYQYLRRKF